MILHRITSKAYAHDLSGTGAMLYGGRWNKKGTPMLYTSATLALAALEILANLSSARLSRNLYCVEIEFPEDLPIHTIDRLANGWNRYPHTTQTVELGTRHFESGCLCLRVPSAIIPTEFNFVLNPLHAGYRNIRVVDVRPLILDDRLLANR